ncbi:MAG: J domain-containing protein [Thermoplasmatota archaeon]
MYERSLKGIRYQMWGLNLFVLALLLLSVLRLAPGFVTFVLALGMILMSGIGLVLFIIGEVFLLLGSRQVRNLSLTVGSLLMLVLGPFVFIFGIVMLPPVNIIMIHMALWLILGSPVLPYMRIGGLITGMLALVAQTALLIYTLMMVLYGSIGVSIPLVIIFLGAYLLLLEVSMVISSTKVKRMRDDLEVVEGTVEGAGELDLVARETFEVPRSKVEYEVSAPFEPGRKEPVTGKALELDRLLYDMSRKEKEREEERYEVEEEEIDITIDDLFLDGQDLYQILKLPRSATSNEIRKAYRRRALLFHPDRYRNTGPLYSETLGREMRKLNKAKEILLDPARRTIYDSLLERMS